ncbi:MAG: hypothetical protein ACE5I1_16395, partial [bacterium]
MVFSSRIWLAVSLLFIFIHLFQTNSLFGQELKCINYTIENGLPTNLTKTTLQDETGFIWIGTDAGLLRFDGREFLTFTDALPGKYVKDLFITSGKKFLVVTDLGISTVDRKNGKVSIETFLIGSSARTDSALFYPKTIYEDRHGILWISEPDAVVRYADGKIKRYVFPKSDHSKSFIRSFLFLEDHNERLLVSSQAGNLFFFDPVRDVFQSLKVKNVYPKFSINALLRTKNGRIFIGGSHGVFELLAAQNSDSLMWRKRYDILNVQAIAENNSGHIFIGTIGKGVFRIAASQTSASGE